MKRKKAHGLPKDTNGDETMTKLEDKERQIIRLAYKTKDTGLRRKAVERVVEARYNPEFKRWADAQGAVFRNPETGRMVRFNSLKSAAQKDIFRRWRAGEYHAQGGPPPPGGEAREEKPKKPEREAPAPEARVPARGEKHKDRTELRGEPRKKMEDHARVTDEELNDFVPRAKLDRIAEGRGRRFQKWLRKAPYRDLDALRNVTRFLLQNPDDEYSRNHWLVKGAKLAPQDIKNLHEGLTKKLRDTKGRLYSRTVLEIANNNDLEGVDADAVWQFRADKPKWGRRLSPEELKQKFLAGPWARDPEVRERVQKMSADEFMAMRNSIFEQEEEEDEFDLTPPPKRTAGEIEEPEEDDEEMTMMLLESPPAPGKKARLSEVGRKIVRIAYESKDPEVRKKIVKLVAEERPS